MEYTSVFQQAIDLIVNIIFDNNYEYQTFNCKNLYQILEKYVEIFEEKSKQVVGSEEY